jgi:ATP-dependent Lon protease
MTLSFEADDVIDAVAVFPLPQVVLFPGAMMPLHIFEPRYRTMTRDVLENNRLLVVAQIPEDHGTDGLGQPEFSAIAGIGEVVRHDALPDGRFNILVRGHARVRLEELALERPYRRARATLVATEGGKADAAAVRALTTTALQFAARVRVCHPTFDFALPETQSPGALADACAHYLVLDGAERQQLLETLDDAERVERCLEALMRQQAEMEPGGGLTN